MGCVVYCRQRFLAISKQSKKRECQWCRKEKSENLGDRMRRRDGGRKDCKRVTYSPIQR
jgi:hypothetical protein